MKYRTLILTVFMAIGCMSNAAEPKPQTSLGLSLLKASVWTFGGLTVLLGATTRHFYAKASRPIDDPRAAHNKEVIDSGQKEFQDITGLHKDLASIIAEYHTNEQEYVAANNSLLFRPCEQDLYPRAKIFALLSEEKEEALYSQKSKIRTKEREELFSSTGNMILCVGSAASCLGTATLFFVSGSALTGTLLLKNLSSKKS